MSGYSTANDRDYSTEVCHEANKTIIRTVPLRQELPAAEVTIDRTRGDDGSVTVIVERKK